MAVFKVPNNKRPDRETHKTRSFGETGDRALLRANLLQLRNMSTMKGGGQEAVKQAEK